MIETINRRRMLQLSAAPLALGVEAAAQSQSAPLTPLPLEQYQPKSMLHVAETRVPRARYPVIDFHTHITMARSLDGPGQLRFHATAEECLAVMDRKNIRTMVDVTGSYGD